MSAVAALHAQQGCVAGSKGSCEQTTIMLGIGYLLHACKHSMHTAPAALAYQCRKLIWWLQRYRQKKGIFRTYLLIVISQLFKVHLEPLRQL